MGQSQSNNQATKAAKVDFNPQVEVVQKVYDAHYGEIKIVRDVNTNEQMILKDIVVNTKEAFEKEIDYLTKRVDVKHPNVVTILGYNTQDKHNFCSTYYKISLFIEYLEQDLQKEQESRVAINSHFTEGEVLYIADNLIAGLSSFQSHEISHGDIRPFNIFVRENNYKLSDPTLNAQKGSNGLTAAIVQGSKTLLAPQLLEQVPKGNYEIKADRYKADVFSLGATLLGLSTLTNSEDLYDYQTGIINAPLLQERLDVLKRNNSEFTYDLIRSMLTVEEEARPDFVMLSNRLLPYQEQIRSGHVNFASRGNFQFETAKRSALPNFETDDLEARIKAALERTAATFRAVEARDLTYQPTGTTATYTSTYQYTPQQATYTTEKPAGEGEREKRSALPAEAGSYSYTSTYAPAGEELKKSTAPAEAGSYSYTSSYVPAYTTEKPAGEELKKSTIPAETASYSYTSNYVPASTYTTDVLRQSYTQPATYTYTSSYLPTTSYTAAAYATGTGAQEAGAEKDAKETTDVSKSYVATGDYSAQPFTSNYTTSYTTTTYNYGTNYDTTYGTAGQAQTNVETAQPEAKVEEVQQPETRFEAQAGNVDANVRTGEAVSQNAL